MPGHLRLTRSGSTEPDDMGLGNSAFASLLKTICAVILGGVLVAGLWPFHAPKNDVSWLNGEDGVRFGDYGSIVSDGTFKISQSQAKSASSIEIWLEPGRIHSSGTILAFYQSGRRAVPFALRQSLGDLVIQLKRQKASRVDNDKIYVDDVLIFQKPVFLTICSDQSGTTIYSDGIPVKKTPTFRFSDQDLTGQLIIGNSPITTHNWSGKLRAFAIYDHDLTASEVSQHYLNWVKKKGTDIDKSEGLVALYLFDERGGNVAHNRMDPTTNLQIPNRFFILSEQFLERPWDEFQLTRHYWEDISINIAGFIPVGFFFCAYFSAIRKFRQAMWLTTALGFAVSLTIEVLQAFLPTRDSGMTDLITNTFGTALGTMLWRWTVRYFWLIPASSIDSAVEQEKDSLPVR